MAKITVQSITKILESKGYKKAYKSSVRASYSRNGITDHFETVLKGDFIIHRSKDGKISVDYPFRSKLSKYGEEHDRLNEALSDSGLIVGKDLSITEKGSDNDPTVKETRGSGSTGTSGTGK